MDRLRNIVVGVDFSLASLDALAQAKRVASWSRSEMSAVHVIDTVAVLDIQEALSMIAARVQDGLIEDAKSHWKALIASNPWLSEIPFDVVVTNAVVELSRRVSGAEAEHSLLVMGVNSKSTDDGGVGAIASGCVRHAQSSVLLVRQGHPGAFKRVVACVDFSETSREAVDQAIRVSAQDGSELHVLHVHSEPRTLFGFNTRSAMTPLDAAKERDRLREKLLGFCESLGAEAVWARERVVAIEASSHGRGIIDYATGVGADLVVLGVRGRTNLRDLVLGSTAERVLRNARCSVLTVHPKAT
jgi:nucleotide-binding universal stress UspA family protein